VYSLSQDVSSLFAIHPRSGRITAISSLNREEMEQIRFSVVATDMGRPHRSTAAVVVVTVADVNDEAPRFLDGVGGYEIFCLTLIINFFLLC
jgi:hypothetical protein